MVSYSYIDKVKKEIVVYSEDFTRYKNAFVNSFLNLININF